METPRDVKRFLSVFEFYFEGHIIRGEIDVNFTDLVLLETLRMFDPVAYEEVSHAFQKRRNIFIELLFDRKETRHQFAMGINGLVDERKLSESEKTRLRALLHGMFPQAIENASTRNDEWDRDNRICYGRHFPKYFQLVADPGDVPAATIADLIKAGQDREQCRAILLKAAQDDVFMRLVERLRSVKDDLPEESVEPIVGALFDISDDLPTMKAGIDFNGDGERELARFALFLLTRVSDLIKRGDVLQRAIASSTAITGPVICTSMLEPREKEPAGAEDQVIAREVVEAIKAQLRPRLWQAAKTGELWRLRVVSYLIYRLRDWTEIESVRRWLSEAIKSPGHAGVFATRMLQVSSVSAERTSRKVFKIPVEQWAEFVDLDELRNSAAKAAEDELLRATIEKLGSIVGVRAKGTRPKETYVISQDSDGKFLYDRNDATL